MKNKGLVGLIIVIFLAVIAVCLGAYFATTNKPEIPTQTTNQVSNTQATLPNLPNDIGKGSVTPPNQIANAPAGSSYVGLWLEEKNYQYFNYSAAGVYDPTPVQGTLGPTLYYIEFTKDGRTCIGGDALIKKNGDCAQHATYHVSANYITVEQPAGSGGPSTRYVWTITNNKLQLRTESFYAPKNEWQPMMIVTYTRVS